MTKLGHRPQLLLAATALFLGGASQEGTNGEAIQFEEARIFFEYNQTDNDLGVHVFLDGEDWKEVRIESPTGRQLIAVQGNAAFQDFGLTELFFEGAEPSLEEVPLDELLGLFPEGVYRFRGRTVRGEAIEGESTLTHAVPSAPEVTTEAGEDDALQIRWTPVSGPPPDFPDRPVEIVAFQVILDSFEVTLPADATSVTVPPEFVASLETGEHELEVLAIEEGGNQSITEIAFER